MPRRQDLKSICLIGSGPIVIGQACEFDYAGCQALKVLREDGFRTIVVNSNPATIMTDPGFADATYLEPLDLEGVADVLGRERPDALLPTLGGQTALNLAIELADAGILRDLGVELLGAPVDVIRRAEDRELFRDAVQSCGLTVPSSRIVTSVDDLAGVAVPAVVRPAFTLGGHGGGFVSSAAELRAQVERGLRESPIGQVLVEESVKGWDEFELEVIRDRRDNVVIVCSIENLDPMGVHTGDSVTVAPQLTLSDEAYQELRDAAIAVIRAVGVETGGSNIQFAREPRDRRDPRDRDEPARLALVGAGVEGDRLPDREGRRQARRRLHARRDPERPDEDDAGELRADARLRRRQVPALRLREVPRRRHDAGHADEVGRRGDGDRPHLPGGVLEGLVEPRARCGRGDAVGGARRPSRTTCTPGSSASWSSCAWTGRRRASASTAASTPARARSPPTRTTTTRPAARRTSPCPMTGKPRVVILGSGPNRIGQGIEFDYCCVHAAQSFRALGYEAIMVNCNPETVSTDYDTSDRLYFEPLDVEHVLAVCEREQPEGVVIQFGGQTPLKLARAIEAAGFKVLGTPYEAVDLAEDRERFGQLLAELGVRCPEWGIADAPRGGGRDRRPGRLPGARPALVRARRQGDARLLRRGAGAGGDGRRHRLRARRPLPRRSARDRRRRALRRRLRPHRRGDGARRGGRDPLRRLLLRPAGALARRGRLRRGLPGRAPARAGARRRRLAERPARPRRRRGERDRGQPARLADGAVREQGDRPQPRRRRGQARRRRAPARARAARGAAPRARQRQGRRAAVRPLPRLRPGARPRDALDRRGDGERRRPADRVREGRAGGGSAAADGRDGIPLGPRARQGGDPGGRAGARRARLRPARHRRHCCRARSDRTRGDDGSRRATRSSTRSGPAAATSSSTRRRGPARAATAR